MRATSFKQLRRGRRRRGDNEHIPLIPSASPSAGGIATQVISPTATRIEAALRILSPLSIEQGGLVKGGKIPTDGNEEYRCSKLLELWIDVEISPNNYDRSGARRHQAGFLLAELDDHRCSGARRIIKTR